MCVCVCVCVCVRVCVCVLASRFIHVGHLIVSVCLRVHGCVCVFLVIFFSMKGYLRVFTQPLRHGQVVA